MVERPNDVSAIPADALRQKPDRPRREAYLLVGRQIGGLAAVRTLVGEHLAFLEQLGQRGKLLLAGPTLFDRGDQYRGDGCLLVVAADVAEAEQIAAADPYQVHGARQYSVVPWLLSEGSLFDSLFCQSPDGGGPATGDVGN